MEDTNSLIAVISNDLVYIRRDISEIKLKLESNYVTKDEFSIVKNIVYGMVALVLTSFMGALTFLVFKQ